jgi:hypothetical protein
MSDITPYEFVGTAVDSINDSIEFPASIFPRAWKKILFVDSIFKFYPIGELHLKDELGGVTDKIFFPEGLEWNFKIGSTDKKILRNGKMESVGYINHTYTWSEPQFHKEKQATHLSGLQVFILISHMFMKDDYESMIYHNKSISDIVKSILKTDYSLIDTTKIFVTPTAGTDSYPQYSILNREFIENLAMVAYNKTKSPFMAFFNCRGEFYFMSIADMLNQKSVGTYALKFSETAIMDDYSILDYKILHGGIPFNRDNYHNKVYFLNDDGTIQVEQANLQDYYLKQNPKDKFTVRLKYIDEKNRSLTLGIKEDTDKMNYLGKINNLFTNSNLNYRMEIVIRFNSLCVSGKTIEIEIDKPDNKNKAVEFAGKWLICESSTFCDDNGIPSQKLVISKPSIQINQQNPFYGDFI